MKNTLKIEMAVAMARWLTGACAMKRTRSAIIALALFICVLEAVNSSATMRFVDVNSTNATPPYTNWIKAAKNIQDAVDVAATNDVVLVTNGTYAGGITVTNPLTLLSVNGPQFTVINGGGTNRCALLTTGASLTGFTVTKGWTISSGGGGVYCTSTNAFLTNCVISSNSSTGQWRFLMSQPVYYPTRAGGVNNGTLYNCTLTGNSSDAGGGAYGSILYNCTLSGNRSIYTWFYFNGRWYYYFGNGGGVASCTLNNCIVYFNSAPGGANYNDIGCNLNYCCTTPLPTAGIGNITNEPAFVNRAGGDFHLQTNSPCINAGNNAYVTTAIDLDGNPRIAGGTVDMGAYEFQPCITGGQFCDAACSPLNGFSFTFSGAIVGQPYRIQTSTTLAAGSWTDLTNFTYTGPTVITDPFAVVGSKRFYRAVSP